MNDIHKNILPFWCQVSIVWIFVFWKDHLKSEQNRLSDFTWIWILGFRVCDKIKICLISIFVQITRNFWVLNVPFLDLCLKSGQFCQDIGSGNLCWDRFHNTIFVSENRTKKSPNFVQTGIQTSRLQTFILCC